ncbi:hypothetical protein F4778DRAFT_31795 [Xylariomycetidae sp. FL2044]|nr:hypothetical protein F4778DRAFT_31795 [Xylariomycetidae sp. FL2044]
MPNFRGLEVSIISGLDARKFPEYPHPDGSSVRLKTPTANKSGQLSPSPSLRSSASNVDISCPPKTNPCISIYIPSTPGQQFWLKYQINQSPPPSRCMYFKMLINGRHIVSWGIDTDHCIKGTVTKGLYETHGAEHHRSAGAMESRYFHFSQGHEKKSVAEDGGLIQVKVFRCKGRKPAVPKLDVYRDQERYGISSTSGGLVDDAIYYDYHLVDAKESPYATFSFYYRSMKQLEELHLIPQRDTGSRPSSMASYDIPLSATEATPQTGCLVINADQFCFELEKRDSNGSDSNTSAIGSASSETTDVRELQDDCTRKCPEPSSIPAIQEADVTIHKALGGGITADILQRPLPELPKPQSRPSSRSSLRSTCPSLTSSLKKYAESDDFEHEDVRLSTAQRLLIPSESMQAMELRNDSPTRVEDRMGDNNSLSDYASSPTMSHGSQSPALPSPAGYVPTTRSVLERHLNQFDSPLAHSSPLRGRAKIRASTSDCTMIGDDDNLDVGSLKLTEAEWLRRSPSPLKRTSKGVERLWSPRPENRPESTMVLFEDEKENKVDGDSGRLWEGSRREVDGGTVGCIDEAPPGNWL